MWRRITLVSADSELSVAAEFFRKQLVILSFLIPFYLDRGRFVFLFFVFRLKFVGAETFVSGPLSAGSLTCCRRLLRFKRWKVNLSRQCLTRCR